MSGLKKILTKASKRTSKLISPTSSAPGTPAAANGAQTPVSRTSSPPVPQHAKEGSNANGVQTERSKGPTEEITDFATKNRPGSRERKPSFTEQRIARKEDREEENEAQALAREQRKQKAWEEACCIFIARITAHIIPDRILYMITMEICQ
jgi:hypothetical protein